MRRSDTILIKRVSKIVLLLLGSIVACRLTAGAFCVLIAVCGVWAAMQNRLGISLSCFLFFPMLAIFNPLLLPVSSIMSISLRLGPAAITAALMLSSTKRRGRHVLPLGSVFIYLLVAAVSSLGGYAPLISYLKIVNFVILIFGLWLGLRNIDRRPEEVMTARLTLLAICVVILGGSFVLLAFPQYGYLNNARQLLFYNPGLDLDEVARIIQSSSGVKLFAGITNQSQCLAVLAPLTIAWVVCDMLFVEHHTTKLHIALVCMGIPLVYLTRSRASLLASLVAASGIYFYCVNMVEVSRKVRRTLRHGMTLSLSVIALIMIISEIRDNSISRWVRKQDDVEGDQRTLSEAFTSSRLGLIGECMYDFQKNPLLGMGFQVSDKSARIKGLALSAPIEKGVLPIMVLGETGVLGLLCFLLFIMLFYGGCIRRRFYVTVTLFTVMLASNMGEATFFSPGGVGGTLWTISVGGGFLIDTIAIFYKQNALRSKVLLIHDNHAHKLV